MKTAIPHTARRAVPRPASPSAQAGACFSPAGTLDEPANTPPPATLPVDEQAAAPLSPGRSITRVGSGPASAGDRPGGPTPGDWVLNHVTLKNGKDGGYYIEVARGPYAPYRGFIAHIGDAEHIGGITKAEAEANARLIVSSKKLLEYLKIAVNPKGHPHGIEAWFNKSRLLIDQIEGRAVA